MTRHRFTSILVGFLALQLSLVGDSSPCRSPLSGITHGGADGSDAMAMAMAPSGGDQSADADAAPGNGSCDMPAVPSCHLATPCAVSFVAENAVNNSAPLALATTALVSAASAPASIVIPPDLPPPRA